MDEQVPARPNFHVNWRQAVILVLFLVVASMLRLHHLGTDSLWLDETFSLGMTPGNDVIQIILPHNGVYDPAPDLLSLDHARPWYQIWSHMRHDNHPPAFITTLRLWREMFGSSEFAIRSLSVCFSVLAMLAFFDAARHFHGTNAALWAVAIMVVAVPQIQYAQETRSYAMLLMEGMIAVAAVARMERRGPSYLRAIALSLAVLAMGLTHYFSAGAILGLVVYTMVHFRGRARRQCLISFAVVGTIGISAWLPQILAQRGSFSGSMVSWLADDKPYPALAAFVRLVLLPARYVIDTRGVAQILSICLAVFWVLPVRARRRSPGVMFWWIWLACTIAPILSLDLLHKTMHLGLVRYTLLASPAIYALLATSPHWWPSRLGKPWARSMAAVAILIAIVMIPRQAYHPAWRPHWRDVAALISSRHVAGEPICMAGTEEGNGWAPDALYAPLSYYLKPMPTPVVWLLDPPADPPELHALKNRPGLWVLVSLQENQPLWVPPGWKLEWHSRFEGIGLVEHLVPEIQR